MTDRPRRVLVVDDDDDYRDSLAFVLADDGWEVHGARDGAEALALLQSLDPKVILLDWRMPGMDGGEMLARLHAQPSPAAVVLVTASAYAREIAVRHGVRFHVRKPFAIDELLAVMAAVEASSS